MSFGPAVRNGLGIGLGPTATLATAFSQATLDFNFIDNLVFPTDITFTRASSATYFNSAGVLTTAANNVPRLDYNPATLAPRGFLVEEQRVNSIRNNTMVGAVAGTPGTLPTNWLIGGSGSGTLTREVVGVGASNGITYVDLRFSGTTSTVDFNVAFEPGTQIAALTGQVWTESVYLAVVGGSTTNITNLRLQIAGRNSGGTTVETFLSPGLLGSITSSLQRVVLTATLANATTVFVQPNVRFDVPSGVAIDITLRIGLPQLEQGAFATSVIPTTGVAATRSADVASVNTLSPWFNATEGTLYGEITDAAITVGGVSRRIANINDGTESDRITVGWAGATGVGAAFVTDNTVAQATFTSPSGAYPFPTKVALAYKAADFQAAVNGSAFATDTSGTVPTVNRMTIGDVVTGGTGPQNINGHIRRITYYPSRLSNAELQAITA